MNSSRLLKPSDMKAMPWKNGGGLTYEVAISPANAEIAKLDFDWRVSIAHVDSNGPFSQFPGYDRKLVVWKGSGLKLNGAVHAPLAPFGFQGETPITAELVSDPVRDFGVIYRRGTDVEMAAQRLSEDGEVALDLSNGDLFLLCASGEVRIEGFYLNPGDVYHKRGAGSVRVKALANSQIVTIVFSSGASDRPTPRRTSS